MLFDTKHPSLKTFPCCNVNSSEWCVYYFWCNICLGGTTNEYFSARVGRPISLIPVKCFKLPYLWSFIFWPFSLTQDLGDLLATSRPKSIKYIMMLKFLGCLQMPHKLANFFLNLYAETWSTNKISKTWNPNCLHISPF